MLCLENLRLQFYNQRKSKEGGRPSFLSGVDVMLLSSGTERNTDPGWAGEVFLPLYGQAGLPRWLSGKESACQCRRHELDSWVVKIPWSRKFGKPLWKSHGQRSLVGGLQSMGLQESDTI